MKNKFLYLIPLLLFIGCKKVQFPVLVMTDQGKVHGSIADDVIRYAGVPYAQAPIGDLRWREPQDPLAYDTVLDATAFRADPMQPRLYEDMVFRGNGFSEDCLYLNIWRPMRVYETQLPVLIYFNGGGWQAGSGSEPRYDGAALARQGMIVVTVNYREGVFGFLAHPDLTARSEHHTSGNYGLLDQAQAIKWVHDNIGAFGGDANRITIAGESAGSFSVSILMTSPLTIPYLAGAIGSSGAAVGLYQPITLQQAEQQGAEQLQSIGLTIDDLLQLSAPQLQQLLPPNGMANAVVDNYLLTQSPEQAFMSGQQAQVPLMAGWNKNEASPAWWLNGEYTIANFIAMLHRRFPNSTDEQLQALLNAYDIHTDEDIYTQAAMDLCSDLFTGDCTRRWCMLHSSAQTTFVYRFLPPRPEHNPQPAKFANGACHSADIEYAMGNLETNTNFAWAKNDEQLSALFQTTYFNFCHTGNPNYPKQLPIDWIPFTTDEPWMLQLDYIPSLQKDNIPNRCTILDSIILHQ